MTYYLIVFIEVATVYIDVEKKLPLVLTDRVIEADGAIRAVKTVVFEYPEPGPADIYEAGAPLARP